MVKTAPPSGALSAEIVAPCRARMLCAMASPRPAPGRLGEAPRQNRRNKSSAFSGEKPGPPSKAIHLPWKATRPAISNDAARPRADKDVDAAIPR